MSKNVITFSEISAVNFIVGWNVLACSMNKSMSCLLTSHREKTSSTSVTFPYLRLDSAFIKHFCFDFCHEEIGEGNRHFRSGHGRFVNLEIVFSVELKRIFFENKAEYLFKVVGRDGRVVVVVFFVCFAYYCDILILRNVCIQACYIH